MRRCCRRGAARRRLLLAVAAPMPTDPAAAHQPPPHAPPPRSLTTTATATAAATATAGDDAIGGGLCPDAFSLEEMGACLVEKKAEVDAECAKWVDMNVICSKELARCGGVAWGSDAVPCVTEWTKDGDMSADCSESQLVMDKMGAKSEPEPERELSEEELSKVSERASDWGASERASGERSRPGRRPAAGAWRWAWSWDGDSASPMGWVDRRGGRSGLRLMWAQPSASSGPGLACWPPLSPRVPLRVTAVSEILAEWGLPRAISTLRAPIS